MRETPIPPLPGVDPETAPAPGDRGYEAWLARTAISPEGVDRTEIWESLHREPAERLERLESAVRSILELRRGIRPELL